MFLVPAALAVQERFRSPLPGRNSVTTMRMSLAWWSILILMALLVGWRHEVGGDWESYQNLFVKAQYASQINGWWWNDPGYRLLEWIAERASLAYMVSI